MPQSNATVPLSPKVRKRQSRTRQRILDESAHLFIAKGFENVSVEEIIDAAEIARSSFYRFFSNREQVLANIIRPVFEQGLLELEKISTNDPAGTMSANIRYLFATLEQQPGCLACIDPRGWGLLLFVRGRSRCFSKQTRRPAESYRVVRNFYQ